MYKIIIVFAIIFPDVVNSWKIQSQDLINSRHFKRCHRVKSEDSAIYNGLTELNEQNVENVLDLIRPQLESDGGGVELDKIADNKVYVRFTGACVGCAHKSITVKSSIESTLARFLKSPNEDPIEVKLVEDG